MTVTNTFKRWLSAASTIVRGPDENRAQIFLKRLIFSDGTKVDVPKDAIFIFTGANNVGKSTALREIRDYLRNGKAPSLILSGLETDLDGNVSDFQQLITKTGVVGRDGELLRNNYNDYPLFRLPDDYERHFVGAYPMSFFVSHLGAQQRLANTEPARRKDYRKEAPDRPVLWMELDEAHQARINTAFEKSFGASVVLNVMRGEYLELHVVPTDEACSIPQNTKQYIEWINKFPTLESQGDGLRSFVGTLLSLMIHPRNITLMDEPEAFLHPPQAKRLAEIIASEVNIGSQIFLATHNEDIIKSLLDTAGNRVFIARITRSDKGSKVRLLDHKQISSLWIDPLLRTSNVLSALFHTVAVFCEGESDARFLRALMDATKGEERDIDCQFYHVGGKDRIASIAEAIRSLSVPVVAIVDIDILSNSGSFNKLFEALGGDKKIIEKELGIIQDAVAARTKLNYVEFSEKLKEAAEQAIKERGVKADVTKKVQDAMKATSAWGSIKEVGINGFINSEAFKAYERIDIEARKVGLLINRQGELEGFCRSESRFRKGAWLSKVLELDLSSNEHLSEARAFATTLRATLASISSQ